MGTYIHNFQIWTPCTFLVFSYLFCQLCWENRELPEIAHLSISWWLIQVVISAKSAFRLHVLFITSFFSLYFLLSPLKSMLTWSPNWSCGFPVKFPELHLFYPVWKIPQPVQIRSTSFKPYLSRTALSRNLSIVSSPSIPGHHAPVILRCMFVQILPCSACPV